MKKLIFLVSMALCCIANLRAQEAVKDSVVITMEDDAELKKGINEMKLNEEVVYAEVIEMVTDDNEAVSAAQMNSIALLQTHVIEIFAKRMNMKAEDVKEIWDVIDDKCQNITVKKGDLMRVFTYITKDALGLGPKKPDPEDVEKFLGGNEEAAKAKSVVVDIVPGTEKKEEVKKEDAPLPHTVTPEEPETTTPEEVKKEEPVVEEKVEEKTTETTVVDVPVVEESKPVVETKKEEVVKPVVTPELCKTMIAKKTYSKVMSFLKAEKSQHTLMYGNYDTMQSPAKCYVVVVDKATRAIVGVLDKGETDRMNFVTQKMDRFENYRGGNYAVIFVQEY